MVRTFDYRSTLGLVVIFLFMASPLWVLLGILFTPHMLPQETLMGWAFFAGSFIFPVIPMIYTLFIWANERIEVDGDVVRWIEKDGATAHHVYLSANDLALQLRRSPMGGSSWGHPSALKLYALKSRGDEVRFYSSILGFEEFKEIIKPHIADMDPRIQSW